ncbi:MAG: STM4014 family protein [Paracoccaceae bacterium]
MGRRDPLLHRRIGVTTNRVIVMGSGPGRRFDAFKAAANRAGLHDVIPLAYGQTTQMRTGDWLRFESPDESASAMRAVLDAGQAEAHRRGFTTTETTSSATAQLAFGLRSFQEDALQTGVHVTASPKEIALCYDKTRCASHLQAQGIPVPQVFAPPPSFDALLLLLRKEKRLFVKQRFGAGAAGTIALMAGPNDQVVAHTTVLHDATGSRFVKRVRRTSNIRELRAIFDFLRPSGLHVERWVPKAGVEGRTCDLRIVAVRNSPPFAVLRLSRGPITNLHLDAERAAAEALFSLMEPEKVDALWSTVRKVQAAFPDSLTVAPDIAVTADLRSHVVLEVNAFGDHIRHMTIDGLTPQDWQIRQMIRESSYAA